MNNTLYRNILIWFFLFPILTLSAETTTIEKSVCEGEDVILSIPNCPSTSSQPCCIKWADENGNLIDVASGYCGYYVSNVTSPKTYTAIVTKNNLGDTDRFIFNIKIVNPDEVTIIPKQCCWTAGEPVLLEQFEFSHPENSGIQMQMVEVLDGVAPILEGQQQYNDVQFIRFGCQSFFKTEGVEIVVVNSDESILDEEVESLVDRNFEVKISLTKALKHFKDKFAEKVPPFEKVIKKIPFPSVSIAVGQKKSRFKLCCNETEIACIRSGFKRNLFLKGGAGVDGGEIQGAENLLNALQGEFPIDIDIPFAKPITVDVKWGFGLDVKFPEIEFITGCTSDLERCFGASLNLKFYLNIIPKANSESKFFDLLGLKNQLAVSWPFKIKVCNPPFSWDYDFPEDIACPDLSSQSKGNMLFSTVEWNIGEKSSVNVCDLQF